MALRRSYLDLLKASRSPELSAEDRTQIGRKIDVQKDFYYYYYYHHFYCNLFTLCDMYIILLIIDWFCSLWPVGWGEVKIYSLARHMQTLLEFY